MSENKTVLREAENTVIVEGTLLEVRHTEWKSTEGLNIELDIEVAENEVHTLTGMSKYKKEDGSENGIAKGYQTVINEYKSVATHGREEADKVRVNQGRVGLNEYYGQDDKLRSFPQLSTNFVNRVQAGEEFNPRAEFTVEILVQGTKEEFNREGEETGRAEVQGYIPLYGGKVIPFTFKVTKDGATYVQDNYEPGQTVKFYGDIVNFKEKKVVLEEVAFGKPKEKVTYNTVREYVITGGSDPYEEDNAKAFNVEVVRKVLTEREVYLAELKKKKEQGSKTETKKGFDTKSTEKKKISKDDLPF
jgi:hypothetical protein